MTNILSKCGICCFEVKEISHHHHPSQPTKILGAQLNVIFILKHIYELKSDDLESYLRKWGNPGDWLKLCPNCEDDISNVRGIFEKLHQISRELEKVKLGLQEKITNSEWKKVVNRTRKKAEAGVEEALNECRRTICNRRRPRRPLHLQNPFEVGDLKASELVLRQAVDIKEENNEDVAYQEFNFYDENTSPGGHDFIFEPTSDHSTSDNDNGQLKERVSSPPSPHPVRKSRRSLKKIKYSEEFSDAEVDKEETRNHNSSKAKTTPTKNGRLVPEAPATATDTAQTVKGLSWRRMECPVCKAKFQAFGIGFAAFSKHLQTCLSSIADTSHVSLKCFFCGKFCCGASEIRDFLEHVVLCRRRYKGDQSEVKRIPWRDALIKCNLCEGEYSFYIPYPDYIQHIFNYHQHRYVCTQCPWRCRKSGDLGRKHWKVHHKNMLHIPMSERYKMEEGKLPLPHIPWWCPGTDCLQKFWDEASRDEHLKTCPKYLAERSQICSFCDRKYFFEEELLMHRVSVHGYLVVANAHKCHECDVTFENARQLRDHQRRKHRINLFSCDKCDKKFADSVLMWNHVRLVHGHRNEEELKEHTCPHCGKVFGLKFKLRRHIVKFHEKTLSQQPKKPRIRNRDATTVRKRKSNQLKRPTSSCLCSFCGKSFSYARSLSLHTKICRLPQFKCRKCKLGFATEELLNDHKVEVHPAQPSPDDRQKPKRKDLDPNTDKPRRRCGGRIEFDTSMFTLSEDKTFGSCNICEKTYDTIQKLKLHLKLSHLFRSKCESCGKVLQNRVSWRRHKKKCGGAAAPMSTTNSNPKVICDLCGLEIFRSSLRNHVLNVHEKEKRISVICDICGEGFPYKFKMLHHKASEHGIGDFKCDVEGCLQVFWNAQALENHKKVKHEGFKRPRKHFCKFCGKSFPSTSSAEEHEQAMHTNKESKPFKCELCEKTFATKLYKTYHLKHTHKLPKGKL